MSPRPTGILRRTTSGADLVVERTFTASAEDVWRSVTDASATALWIGPWEGHGAPGKTVRLTMSFEEGAPTSNVTIEDCDAPRRLSISMKDDYGDWRLELHLQPTGGSTVLTLVQHLADPSLARDTGPGWEYYLDRLIAAREGAPLPTFDAYYPSQKAHYEAQAAALPRR